MAPLELTRREMLASFLGAAVACRARRTAEPPPPGALAGASHEIGHRLRAPVDANPAHWEDRDVVIVGSGIAGLSAAWQLKKRGIHAVVFELEPSIGGTSRSGVARVSAHPWGAHYVPLPSPENTVLHGLLDEMGVLEDGLPAEQFLCRDPEERIFVKGRWYEGLYLYAGASYDDLRQLRAFEAEVAKWVAWRDSKGRRAFAVPMAHGSDDAEVTGLDRMSMADWLDSRGLQSERLRWFIDYGCRDDYGLSLRDTSAWAGLFYFASRVETPGEESRAFVTFPEGNGRFVAHLSKGIDIRAQWLVAKIRPRNDGADLIAIRDNESMGIRAKRVIFTGPRFLAPFVIEDWQEDVSDFSYGSWMVANLSLSERPESHGFPLAWDNVLYDSPSLGYVVATHQTGLDHGPTVFTYYYPLVDGDPRVARERLLSIGRDGWADVVMTDLERAHPDIRKITERVDIMRWGHAMIRPRPGFVWSAARQRAHEPHRTIHFANTDISGIALFEEALHHGVRAAGEVAAALTIR